ncbi:hypothetical protein [Clostridium sp. 'White wine YQ']|uniref:hypothetical protein n=1 Tax=Clostridium sp. 'White wine YQ' TaxID=3027474 RepID=UPI002366F317|nr:hypothetical protein [Clostridium sp. 'White wine YQ']MDD7793422.1 hypothetical protein [Clostridium sp. 'White wine YQ']
MKKQITLAVSNASKKLVFSILYLSSMIVLFLGIFFSLFLMVNSISLTILKLHVPGIILGVLVLYFGITYYASIIKILDKLYRSPSNFF